MMKLDLKFVALVLGVMVWIYVNLVVSPILRRTVMAKVEPRNVPVSARITTPIQTAEVVLAGTRREFMLAGNDSVQLSMDLYDRRPGKLLVPIRVHTHAGLSVVSLRPAQVEVTLEALKRAKFVVEPEVTGQPAEGFIAEPARIRPEQVEVEGPEDLVRSVTKCKVVLNLTDLRNSISEGKPVRVISAFGELDGKLAVFPDKVNVDVTVKEGYPEKTVTVASPTFLNKPPEGLRLGGLTLDPPAVVIAGPQRVLDQVKEVRLEPVDLSTIQSGSAVISLLVNPYESVKILGSPTIRLSFSLMPVKISRSIPGLALTVKKSPNQHCLVSVSSYTLVLNGFVEDLNQVAPADLAILLDVREMAPGRYPFSLPAPKGLSEKIAIQEILPGQVEVELSEIVDTPMGSGSTNEPAKN